MPLHRPVLLTSALVSTWPRTCVLRLRCRRNAWSIPMSCPRWNAATRNSMTKTWPLPVWVLERRLPPWPLVTRESSVKRKSRDAWQARTIVIRRGGKRMDWLVICDSNERRTKRMELRFVPARCCCVDWRKKGEQASPRTIHLHTQVYIHVLASVIYHQGSHWLCLVKCDASSAGRQTSCCPLYEEDKKRMDHFEISEGPMYSQGTLLFIQALLLFSVCYRKKENKKKHIHVNMFHVTR